MLLRSVIDIDFVLLFILVTFVINCVIYIANVSDRLLILFCYFNF